MSEPFPHYVDLLEHVHRRLRPRTYFEIGVYAGRSLRFAGPSTTAVGIDPVVRLSVVVENPDAQIVAATSDDFFATHDLRELLDDRPVDLAFIDGMHRFEFVLRDLANLQPYCHDDTVVMIHDCLPTDEVCAARERTTVAWAGDVWRAGHALATERPELGFVTLDVAPTGMGVMTGLGRARPLADDLADWTDHYRQVDFAVFEQDPETAVNRRPGTPEFLDELLPVPHS